MLTKSQIQKIVTQATPIDTIISAEEKYHAIEVRGYVGNSLQTYTIYENGQVIQL